MSGTLQVGGLTLGTHNSGTGKVDITNAGATTVTTLNTTSIASGTLGDSVVFPTHHVIQVKYFEHDDSVTVTNPNSSVAGPWINVLSGAITMVNQSNKILVAGVGTAGGNNVGYEFAWRLVRTVGGSDQPIGGNRDPDNTFLGDYIFISGSSSSENATTLSNNYLDTPSTTSEITYKLQAMSSEGSTIYVNRGYSTNNARTWANSGNTTLTLMEIQG